MQLEELEALQRACKMLEQPSLAAKLTGAIGAPIELGLEMLPEPWYDSLHGVVERAIHKALHGAIYSMGQKGPGRARERYHLLLAAGSGAAGGFFGLPGFVVELPVSTTLMLRSIGAIGREEGEDLQRVEAQAACVEVFALGGRSTLDDTAETGYYGVRAALASYMSTTLTHVATRGMEGSSAPALLKLIKAVSVPFGVSVSQRAATRLIPVIGASAGAAVNLVFMQHFQDTARGHFIVRRLERKYGPELVKAHYEQLARGLQLKA